MKKSYMAMVVGLLLLGSIHAMASDDGGPEGTVVKVESQEEFLKLVSELDLIKSGPVYLIIPTYTTMDQNRDESSSKNPENFNNSLTRSTCKECGQKHMVNNIGTPACQCCLYNMDGNSTNSGSSCAMWDSYDPRTDTLTGCCSVNPYNCNRKCHS
jgi:hypothetical protein